MKRTKLALGLGASNFIILQNNAHIIFDKKSINVDYYVLCFDKI
jgi:hypothetical protein